MITARINSNQNSTEVQRTNIHRRCVKFKLIVCLVLEVNRGTGLRFLGLQGIKFVLAIDILNFLDQVQAQMKQIISLHLILRVNQLKFATVPTLT